MNLLSLGWFLGCLVWFDLAGFAWLETCLNLAQRLARFDLAGLNLMAGFALKLVQSLAFG